MEKQEIKYIETSIEIEKAADGKLTFIASKEIVDKDNDIVKIDGIDLKNFKKNPVMLFAHNHSMPAIGKWTNIRKEKINNTPALTMRPDFASDTGYDLAMTMEKLVEGGYIKAVSVGLRPDWDAVEYVKPKGKKAGHRIIAKSFLQEVSFVNVGANQEALSKAVADDFITQKEMDDFTKTSENETEAIDKIHELIDVTEAVLEINKELQEKVESLQDKLDKLENPKIDSYLDKLFEDFQATRTDSPNENANEGSDEDIGYLLNFLNEK